MKILEPTPIYATLSFTNRCPYCGAKLLVSASDIYVEVKLTELLAKTVCPCCRDVLIINGLPVLMVQEIYKKGKSL